MKFFHNTMKDVELELKIFCLVSIKSCIYVNSDNLDPEKDNYIGIVVLQRNGKFKIIMEDPYNPLIRNINNNFTVYNPYMMLYDNEKYQKIVKKQNSLYITIHESIYISTVKIDLTDELLKLFLKCAFGLYKMLDWDKLITKALSSK